MKDEFIVILILICLTIIPITVVAITCYFAEKKKNKGQQGQRCFVLVIRSYLTKDEMIRVNENDFIALCKKYHMPFRYIRNEYVVEIDFKEGARYFESNSELKNFLDELEGMKYDE